MISYRQASEPSAQGGHFKQKPHAPVHNHDDAEVIMIKPTEAAQRDRRGEHKG